MLFSQEPLNKYCFRVSEVETIAYFHDQRYALIIMKVINMIESKTVAFALPEKMHRANGTNCNHRHNASLFLGGRPC